MEQQDHVPSPIAADPRSSAEKRGGVPLSMSFGGFHRLMPHRVQQVLLVSSLYESFVLEEDGLLSEMITSQYLDMHLSHSPRVTRASTADEALRIIANEKIDLLITMTRFGEVRMDDFAESVVKINPHLPIVILADEPRELELRDKLRDRSHIDRVFVWNGDSGLLLAIIKYVEDAFNVEHDTRVGDVRVILLVENSVRFYSAYLPLIYTEVVNLTRSLMEDGINVMHQLLRLRARPKILLAETFEDAMEIYEKYADNMLGVISDIRFPREGIHDPRAGLELTQRIRRDAPYLPVLLQSSDESFRQAADGLSAGFIHKNSPTLLQELRAFMQTSLGFGDFIFTMPDGTEVGRAGDLFEFERMLAQIPSESIEFHAGYNHFSNWLMARTEFEMATRIRPVRVDDFSNTEELRAYLIETLAEFREKSQTGVITDFSPRKFDVATSFTRIGSGSIGGKARGLAFVNALLRHHDLKRNFEGVRLFVPRTAVLGADMFDQYMEENRLRKLVSKDVSDDRICRMFLKCDLPEPVVTNLTALLRFVRYPLAVRSSSLLEDSHGRPFAGIYETYMIPNNHPSLRVRLEQLCRAVKLVYASTFYRQAKHYLDATGHHIEEEKMGVIIQEIVGSEYGGRFYPTFSGVARSLNYYPTGNLTIEEGVVCVALGLGKTVVDGGEYLMFSPDHPEVLPQFSTTADLLANSQRSFYVLNTSDPEIQPSRNDAASLIQLPLDVAEADGTLAPIGSVYSPQNDRVYDGVHRDGARLVTFAHVLKSDLFPLAKILRKLLDIGREGMACPVEIEFAVDMNTQPMEFGFLQIRPALSAETGDTGGTIDTPSENAICFSPEALGNGVIDDVCDVVFVAPDDFDAGVTREIAQEIGKVNEKIRRQGRSCVLIGPGRWGSADRWLGIPVTWDQISTARAIVETALEKLMVAPSQGTHFFQNLTSLGVGYFTVDPNVRKGFIDWDWLAAATPAHKERRVTHLVLDDPVIVKIDGRQQRGVIQKPNGQVDSILDSPQ